MPPFNHFTTKAKEAVRKAHELAVERGQNQVSPLHLMGALLTQEESLVHAILEKFIKSPFANIGKKSSTNTQQKIDNLEINL